MISFLIKWTFFLYIFWIDLFPFCFIFQLPFLRWKRFAFLAASCILCVRAILVQIAFFLHMQVFTMFPFIWFCTRCPYIFNLMNFDQQRYVLGKACSVNKIGVICHCIHVFLLRGYCIVQGNTLLSQNQIKIYFVTIFYCHHGLI